MFNLNTRLLTVSIAAWEAVVVASVFVRTTMLSNPFSATEVAAWLLLAAGPIIVATFIVRGAESSSIAQVLYNAERAPATTVRRTGSQA